MYLSSLLLPLYLTVCVSLRQFDLNTIFIQVYILDVRHILQKYLLQVHSTRISFVCTQLHMLTYQYTCMYHKYINMHACIIKLDYKFLISMYVNKAAVHLHLLSLEANISLLVSFLANILLSVALLTRQDKENS